MGMNLQFLALFLQLVMTRNLWTMTVSMRPIAQAEDLPAEFEEDEDIFAEADLAMEQMDELREQARAEELKRLEHQFAEFEADYAAFEEEYGASEENTFSGAN